MFTTTINHCKPDYHITIVCCGVSCVPQYREYNQTLKLLMSEYGMNHMIVSSPDWTDYNDVVKYRGSKSYCVISNGCFISIHKPSSVDEEYGGECVVVKLTNDNKP